MRLSASLTLTLLASANLSPSASAFRQDAKYRILKRIEAGSMPKPGRELQSNKGGNGGGKSTGGGTDNGPGKSSQGGNKAKGYGATHGYGTTSKGGNGRHSAHLDANDAGIATDAIEYEYGTPVEISFELTNELVPADVLATLDVERMDEWTVGAFMRMADPQDGALPPIISVKPVITAAGGGRKLLKEAFKGLRRLQDTTTGATDAPATTTGATDPASTTGATDPATTGAPPPEPREPPTLNYVAAATFVDTGVTTLDPNEYGIGFDVYLLDETGRAVIGPATFYMKPTAAMVEEAEAAKATAKPDHPLVRHDHASKFKGKGKGSGKGKGKGSGGAAGGKAKENGKWGMGSGSNGGMIISTAESLATYELYTDALHYALGADVTVTYDLSPDIIEGGRRLQRGNGNGSGGGAEETSTTTTTTSTSASDGDGTTTIAATTTEAEVDMGAGEEEGGTEPVEEQPTIDPDDVTLYSVGVYMRMAHPQGGALPPIVSRPFCEDADSCGSPESLEMGSKTFNTDELDVDAHGIGYDVWILNGLGEGKAGPYTFYVDQ